MESEYVALSDSLRRLIPMRNLLLEIAKAMNMLPKGVSTIHSTIWEDNHACLKLASADPPRMTPRSKAIALKYHWFREHLRLSNGAMVIKQIATTEQIGDIFTKALSPKQFAYLRHKLLGW